jgi:hypothetical protein
MGIKQCQNTAASSLSKSFGILQNKNVRLR